MLFLRAVCPFKSPVGPLFPLKFGNLDLGRIHLRDLKVFPHDGQFNILLRIAMAKGRHSVGHKPTH